VATTATSLNDEAPALHRNTKQWEEARGSRYEQHLEHADARGQNSAPETGRSKPLHARRTYPPRRVPPREIPRRVHQGTPPCLPPRKREPTTPAPYGGTGRRPLAKRDANDRSFWQPPRRSPSGGPGTGAPKRTDACGSLGTAVRKGPTPWHTPGPRSLVAPRLECHNGRSRVPPPRRRRRRRREIH